MTSICGISLSNVYVNVFKSLVQLSVDSSQAVSIMADKIVQNVMGMVRVAE